MKNNSLIDAGGEKKKSTNEANGYEGVDNFSKVTDTECSWVSFQTLQSWLKLNSAVLYASPPPGGSNGVDDRCIFIRLDMLQIAVGHEHVFPLWNLLKGLLPI